MALPPDLCLFFVGEQTFLYTFRLVAEDIYTSAWYIIKCNLALRGLLYGKFIHIS